MSALLLTAALLAGPAGPQDADLRAVAAPPGMFEGDFAAAYEALLSRLEEGRGPEAEIVSRLRDLDLDGDVRHRTAAGARRLEATARGLADAEASYQLRRMARRAFDAAAFAAPDAVPADDLFGDFLEHWYVVGPLGAADELFPVLGPVPDSSPAADLARGRFAGAYRGVDGEERRWEPVRRARNEAFVRAASGLHPDTGYVFAAAFVRSTGAADVQRGLEVRSPGAFRAWWNGEAVIEEPRVLASDVGDARRALVELRSGWNALLVCLPGSDAGAVGARLVGADGGVLTADWTQFESGEVPALPTTAWAQGTGGVAPWPGKVEHDPGLRYDGGLVAELDGGAARVVAMLRAQRAGRNDVVLTMPAPAEGGDLERAWHHARLRAIEAAPHLSSDVRRRMLVESLDALRESGGLPALPRWSEIRLLLAEDRPLEALARAEEWRALFPERALPRFAEIACLRQVDRTWALAQPALEALVRDHPTHVGARAMLMEHLAGQGDDAGAVAQAEAILRCDATHEAAFELLLESLEGSDSPLLEELAAAVEARRRAMPGSGFWRGRVRRLLDVRGDRAGLLALAEERVAEAPRRPESWWNLAGARLRLGDRDGALEALAEELLLEPGDPVTTELLSHLGVQGPAQRFFEAFGPDLDTALDRARSVTDASVVEALDDGLVYYYPSGASLTRSHTLSIARDRAGTEALSRTAAAGRTREKRVLTLDGRELEPVLTEGEWVLPSLEPGDVVESVWENHAAANRGGPPASAGWRFASFEKAFPTSRWTVFVPEGLARGRIELGAFDGRVESIPWEGGTVHVYEASSPRQQQEPWQPSYREVLPWAAFGDDLPRGPELRAWRARTAGLAHLPADLIGEVKEFALAAAGDREGIARARAIHDALEERLQDHQGPPDAARTWLTRSGDPLCLLAAMYGLAGVDHRWAVIERAVAPELNGEPIEAFRGEQRMDRAALFLPAEGSAGTWIVPLGAPGMPFGSLPAALGGAPAHVLESDGTTRSVSLPRRDDAWDLEVELTYRIAPDGSAEVMGRTTEGSPQGFVMARRIAEATDEQRRGYALSVASRFAPGADISAAEVVVDGSEGPGVVVLFEGALPGFLQPRGQESVAFLPFVPLQLSQRFGPAERKWPLALRQSVRLRARIEVQHGTEWEVVDGPRPGAEGREGLTVSLAVDRDDPAVTRLTQTFVQQGAVVEPADMPAFLEAMSRLQGEFQRPLQLRR